MSLPRQVHVVEVGPRDGLQNEAADVPTDVKVELVERLAATGLRTVETTSFVNPKAVPQLADADAVLTRIERREGVNTASLAKIKARLIRLAARTDLFDPRDYPPPEAGQKLRSCLYRLSEDPDHRFALYANASLGGYGTPAHNHTTWAVIVGVTGEEQNRFYDRSPGGGVREKGRDVVRQGTGVAFMPEDLLTHHRLDRGVGGKQSLRGR